ncbi:RNA polymerase sigma factor [Sphingomonas colocasiae]|uniref:RNA polymerase sigma factor n=1 Tax=Sphingomonas colocasiae TaxID=1848973 RepID=A0ABS7PP85_9SPHN|nr:RNA polymerase sigma factor [Sphingomonas colocasiae]
MAKPDVHQFDPAARGDRSRAAVEHAFRTHRADLCRAIERQFGAGPPEPEEAVQSAFESFAKLDTPETVSNPRSYLFIAARNFVLDQRRRAKVRLAARDDVELIQSGDTPANLDTERVFIAKEHLAIVGATLDGMEPKRREVMTLHIVHDLRYVEIARRLGISETRVRQLMASALAQCTLAINASGSGAINASGSGPTGTSDESGAR